MMHFVAGMSLMYILASLREEWIRACRITEHRARINTPYSYRQGNVQSGPNVEPPTNIPTTDGPVSALPPLLPYPRLYRIK